MSKIDYNKFSGKPVIDTKPTQTNDELVETKNETVTVNEVEPVQTTTTEPEVKVQEPEAEILTSGTVARCTKLNIRKMPNLNSEVICAVDVGTKVSVDIEESTNAWYKVCLDTGDFGYCMKNYITIE